MTQTKGEGRPKQEPWRRPMLPQKRKNLRLELRLQAYAKLERLRGQDGAGRPEPIVSVVERLIAQASELPAARS